MCYTSHSSSSHSSSSKALLHTWLHDEGQYIEVCQLIKDVYFITHVDYLYDINTSYTIHTTATTTSNSTTNSMVSPVLNIFSHTDHTSTNTTTTSATIDDNNNHNFINKFLAYTLKYPQHQRIVYEILLEIYQYPQVYQQLLLSDYAHDIVQYLMKVISELTEKTHQV